MSLRNRLRSWSNVFSSSYGSRSPSYRGGSRGRVHGVRTPPPRDELRFSNTTGILQKKTMWFICVEVEQETSALPPKNIPGFAPELYINIYLKVGKLSGN